MEKTLIYLFLLYLQSDKMFNGEFEGLKAILKTKTVQTPNPIATGCTRKGQQFIVMEYLNMTSLDGKCSSKLGSQLADMHLINFQEESSINQFGFHVETCCGFIPQKNTWTNDWLVYTYSSMLLGS